MGRLDSQVNVFDIFGLPESNDLENGLKESRKELCIEGQNDKKEIPEELIKKYFETMNSSVLPF